MSDIEQDTNEYVDLPDDPEKAFADLQQRKYADLERISERNEYPSWRAERRYVDILTAFDEVHGLGIFTAFGSPPFADEDFSIFFHDFSRCAEMSSQKIKMEEARRLKTGAQNVIVLDATKRKAIHILINAIREELNEFSLPENKREALFNKLNDFAAEVDRNRTRTEAFLSFVVDMGRASRELNDELKPLLQKSDRIIDLIEKAKKWNEALPPWKERMKIEGPPKRLAPPQHDIDDEIPF